MPKHYQHISRASRCLLTALLREHPRIVSTLTAHHPLKDNSYATLHQLRG